MAGEEAAGHAGWKAQAWATRWAVPTGMELCGLAVAVTAVARKREIKKKNTPLNTSLRPRTLGFQRQITSGVSNKTGM